MFYKDKLKSIRTSKKITRKKLASMLGKSEQIIYYWETGKRKPCDSDIRIIAGFLDIKVSEISNLKDVGLSIGRQDLNLKNSNSDLSSVDKIIKDHQELPPSTISTLKELRNRIIEVGTENARLVNRINRYESLINNLSPIIYVKDVKYKYKLINSSFLHTLKGQYSYEDILGSKATDIYGYKEIAELLKHEQHAINAKEKVSNKQIKIPRTHKVGLLSIVPRLDDHGNVTEIVCSIKDITDLSEALDIMQELEMAMNMIDQAVWIAIYNQEKNKYLFTYITNNLEEIHNISIKNLNANFHEWEKPIFEKDKETFRKWLRSEKYPKELEYRIVDSNGNIKWLFSKTKKMRNIVFGVITDITEKVENDRKYKNLLADYKKITNEK